MKSNEKPLQPESSGRPSMDAMCQCGKRFGTHHGQTHQCPTSCECGFKTTKFRPAQPAPLARPELLRRLKALLIEHNEKVPGVHHTVGFNCGILQLAGAGIPKVHNMQLGWGAPPDIDVWVRNEYGRARRPVDRHLRAALAHFERLVAASTGAATMSPA